MVCKIHVRKWLRYKFRKYVGICQKILKRKTTKILNSYSPYLHLQLCPSQHEAGVPTPLNRDWFEGYYVKAVLFTLNRKRGILYEVGINGRCFCICDLRIWECLS